jgi:flagellar export protein FliJ
VKRFVFRLERLERVRKVRRAQARAKLSDALAELRGHRARTQAQRQALDESLRVELPQPLAAEPWALKQLAEWQVHHRRLVERLEREEAEAGRLAREALGRYAEAGREHRVLERLRERRHRQWLEQAEGQDRKFLDEMHLLRLGRQRSGMGG